MNYDVNNQAMLSAGSYYAAQANQGQGWRPISTAPKDGTIVEIRCTYGVAPWFGLYRWIKTPNTYVSRGDGSPSVAQDGRWTEATDDRKSFDEGLSFSWRPFQGDVSHYVDPTGGAQDSPAYWRGAVASRYNLPLDTFESQTASNVAEHEQSQKPWWQRLLGWWMHP